MAMPSPVPELRLTPSMETLTCPAVSALPEAEMR
jgi:hypothetical protein